MKTILGCSRTAADCLCMQLLREIAIEKSEMTMIRIGSIYSKFQPKYGLSRQVPGYFTETNSK
jgi:hypothetical protein